jgi:hypothetical protein
VCQVGAVIGKGGSVIKHIRESTGVNLQVNHDILPNSTERFMLLSGTAASVTSAVLHIMRKLAEVCSAPCLRYSRGSHRCLSAWSGYAHQFYAVHTICSLSRDGWPDDGVQPGAPEQLFRLEPAIL